MIRSLAAAVNSFVNSEHALRSLLGDATGFRPENWWCPRPARLRVLPCARRECLTRLTCRSSNADSSRAREIPSPDAEEDSGLTFTNWLYPSLARRTPFAPCHSARASGGAATRSEESHPDETLHFVHGDRRRCHISVATNLICRSFRQPGIFRATLPLSKPDKRLSDETETRGASPFRPDLRLTSPDASMHSLE
jgi:hypothetical protein